MYLRSLCIGFAWIEPRTFKEKLTVRDVLFLEWFKAQYSILDVVIGSGTSVSSANNLQRELVISTETKLICLNREGIPRTGVLPGLKGWPR